MRNGLRDGATSLLNLVRERRHRSDLYGKAHYWDARAKERTGLSRSLWPSNAYNLLWDERQRTVLGRVLGDVSGLRILDVGCGTGRMTRHLARHGASVVGVDFSKETADLAAEETRSEGLTDRTRFETGDVLEGFDGLGTFDRILIAVQQTPPGNSASSSSAAFRSRVARRKTSRRLLKTCKRPWFLAVSSFCSSLSTSRPCSVVCSPST